MTYDATRLPDLEGQSPSQVVLRTAYTVPENGEPISLQQAKDHLRVVISDENDYIEALITAARQMAEGATNRTLVQRSLTARFTGDDSRYWLRKPPIVSVDTVTSFDSAYAETRLNSGGYVTIATDDSTEVRATIPHGGALEVEYTAGYAPGEVPKPIIQWMLLCIGTMYESRETVTNGTAAQTYALGGNFVDRLLQPYTVYE